MHGRAADVDSRPGPSSALPPRRTGADVATVVLGAAGLAVVVSTSARGLPAPPAAAVLGAVALVLVPGTAVVGGLRHLEPWARWALAPAVGLGVLGLLALVQLELVGWYPTAAAVAALVVGTAVASLRCARALRRSGRPPAGAGPVAGAGPQRRAWPRLLVRPALLVLVLALWSTAVLGADIDGMGVWGLLEVLPLTWYAALAVTLLWALGELLRGGRRAWPAVPLVLLQVVYYATPAVVEAVPRFSWTYKHVAVADYFVRTGVISQDPDIYQRWPTFFGAAAIVDHVLGVPSAATYAAWAEPGFALVNVFLVVAIAFLLTRSRRTAWAAGLVFTVGNWIGQNYFAPQAYAYALALAGFLLVLSLSGGGEPGRLGRLVERAASTVLGARRGSGALLVPGGADAAPPRAGTSALGTALLVLALHTAVTSSHQLTPYFVVLALLPLSVLGLVRPRGLPVAMAVVTVAYLVLNLDYIRSSFGIFSGFDPVANATYSPGNRAARPFADVLQGYGTWSLTAAVYAWGAVGLVRRARAGMLRQALVVFWLAFSPALVLAGQTYGGEGRLRVVLFALPWLSVAAAWAVWPSLRADGRGGPGSAARGSAVRFGVPLLVVASLFTAVSLQPESRFHVDVADLRASRLIAERAVSEDVVVAPSPNVPLPVSVGLEAPPVVAVNDLVGQVPEPLAVDEVDEYARALTSAEGATWMVFSDATTRYCAYACLVSPGDLDRLEASLAGAGFTTVLDQPEVRVYRRAGGSR
ncbi:hypothetical protein [Kineococcus terrestris]|uniref:hypothetical protein n=1 Tax=Kineococcus terrestris TaxID=2044856 RepID=UPI0034DAE843